MTITFGSLFAGIGGFDLGFERAGMACKWQVEIDDYATRVLEKHWPGVHRERDIKQCGKHNLEQVDVICGGFPCQDISYAGRGAGLDGERSGLFFEAVRVVRELRPRVVVLENVAALLTRGLDRVLGTLAEVGFDAEWHCIPAAAVGAPHIRDRLFIISNANDGRFKECQECDGQQEEAQQPSQRRNAMRLRDNVANAESQGLQGRAHFGDDAKQKLQAAERSNRESGGHWLSESGICRVANGVPRRVDRLRGLGNAVVPQVAEWIGRNVVDILEKELNQ